VHQISVRCSKHFLDALLARRQHQLLELTMCRQQHLGGGRLERNPTLGPDDGIAEVNAATDAEGSCQALELLDDRDRPKRLAIDARRSAALEAQMVTRGWPRLIESAARQYPGSLRNAAARGQRLLTADRDSPQASIG